MQNELDKIFFTISPYNFKKSFDLFVQLTILNEDTDWAYLTFSLKNVYVYIAREEHLASVMSMYPEEFGFIKSSPGNFSYREKDMNYSIFDQNKWNSRKEEHYVLNLTFNPQNIVYQDIQDFIYSLVEKNVIYKV